MDLTEQLHRAHGFGSKYPHLVQLLKTNKQTTQNRKQLLLAALKNTEEDKEEKQEAAASLTPAKDISLGAAVEAVLSEPDYNFTLHTAAHHRVVTCS